MDDMTNKHGQGQGEVRLITLSEQELRAMMRNVADEAIAHHEIERHRSHLSVFDVGTIEGFLDDLPNEHELGYGRTYLRALLNTTDASALEHFVDKGLEAMDEDGSFDLRHFNADERKLFEQLFLGGESSLAKPENMTRRTFMRHLGTASAVGFLGEFATDVTAKTMKVDDRTHYPDWQRRVVQKADAVAKDWVSPIALGGIGLHILNDMEIDAANAKLKSIAEKLAHIEYAVDELAERSKQSHAAAIGR